MASELLENPKLFRHVLEDMSLGIYLTDRDGCIRFWNHGAERLVGRLSHEVVGHKVDEVVHACDQQGKTLSGDRCPIAITLAHGEPQRCTVFYLHKSGHRTAVQIRTKPIIEHTDVIVGVAVLFEEAFVHGEQSGPPMYGCLDATTGLPSRILTRAVINECLAGVKTSHSGFGLIRVRMLGLDEFRSKHGPQSAIPFVKTAAQTLRHSLAVENYLGRWEEGEFLIVLPHASPVIVTSTAQTLWFLLERAEVTWWGDQFPVESEVSYAVATALHDLESLLRDLKVSHSSVAALATANGTTGKSGSLRG